IVLVGQHHSKATRTLLRGSATPVVEVLEASGKPIDCCVGFSNFAASYEITSRLVTCGLDKIAFICAPLSGNDRVQRRLDGYKHALAEAGVAFDQTLVATAEFSIKKGMHAFAAMISRHPDLRAVVSNDILGVGVLLHCLRAGIDVPGQVSVTGFDDLELASIVEPPLTTVRINGRRMGEVAAEEILTRQHGSAAGPKTIDLGYETAWRGSTPAECKPPRA
ncbi:MAG: substrate-binding domain-containing protein, partial [Pseudomonadota bacterium]